MTENERKRIEEDADRYGFQIPYDGSSEFYDRSAIKAYIAGATAERNLMESELKQARNAVIDECIEKIKTGFGTIVDYNLKPVKAEIFEDLESLKFKQ